MKLLQRLRELRNNPDGLIESLSFPNGYVIEAGVEAYGVGAMMEQEVLRFDLSEHPHLDYAGKN